MSAWRRFFLRLANVFRPAHAEPDLAREVASHLTLLEDDFECRGMTPEEARLAARRAFGGVEQTKERQRDARSFVWLDDARRDVRHSARLLRRNPIFAMTAALSLAIGIGADTAIFTVANALLFHVPVGVADPGRLVDIGFSHDGGAIQPGSYPNYLDVRERATTLDGVYGHEIFGGAMSLTSPEGAERIFATAVTANYFRVLGARPAAGRLFGAGEPSALASDDKRAAADPPSPPGMDAASARPRRSSPFNSERAESGPILVLSHRFWTRRFKQDPAIVGRTLTLNGRAFTVVGVASEGFQGTRIVAGDVWIPLNISTPMSTLTNRAGGWLVMGGRLKPGVSMTQASAELDGIGRALGQEYPEQNRGKRLRIAASGPLPANNGVVAGFFAVLIGIVSLVLAVACANVAGVLLARAATRRREIAVRMAIGAGRARLVRQLLTETMMLFVLGGAGGVLLARGITSLLVSRLPALPFPVEVSLALDGRVIAFTTGLSLVAALLSGLAPALQASKADVVSALKDDSQGPSDRWRLRNAFVVGQVALSLMLIVCAGLFVRALQRAGSMHPGFDPYGVKLASLDLRMAGYTNTTGPRFARELVDRVRQLPGVENATIARVVPGGFEGIGVALTAPGITPRSGQPLFEAAGNSVEPGYFATLRIPLVAGRDFGAADRDGTQPVAIVSEAVARRFWPGKPSEEAIGKYVLERIPGPNPSNNTNAMLVIGVARNVTSSSLIDGLRPLFLYVPLQQQYASSMMIVARTTHGQPIADELRTLVASMNPNLPIVTTQTIEDSMALGLVPQRLAVSVSGSLGLVGLLLAAIGIYGVTAFWVARQTREIGIRLALGAERAAIVRMVLRQGLSIAAIGSVIGLALAAGAGQMLAGFLVGLPPFDPVIFGGAAVLFAAIGLAACYGPARRATKVDPIVALRCE